ncbi:MAG TPA: VOC family protein [Polyangiales bacterium]|nr:VOC family protein [Polyangiales bacterium]
MDKNTIGILRIDSLHFFVRDLERNRAHYTKQLGFVERAVSGPEFTFAHGVQASLLEAGEVCFVFMAPVSGDSECASWLARHPEGVGRVVFEVQDVEHAYHVLRTRGATPTSAIEQGELIDGRVRWFDIATPLGATTFRFVQRAGMRAIFPGLIRHERRRGVPGNRFGVLGIDHLTSNFLSLAPAVAWMEQVLGFERFWDISFHTRDVRAEADGGSGLNSIVMWDPASGIKLANNEPAAPALENSQIYRFCVEHRGAGVQHVALAVQNILGCVSVMRGRGVGFMPTPSAYYDRIRERGIQLTESIEKLRRLQVLVDGEGSEYLLQIFLRDAASTFGDAEAGPLFLELIQRKGDRGFGAGNFRALFESIEREQTRAA